MGRTGLSKVAAIASIALASYALAPALSAQQATGNLLGTVSDEQGAGVPGVTVTLTGIGAPQSSPTDAAGEFRFWNLSPGGYSLTFELQGFARIAASDVQVAVGKTTEMRVRLTQRAPGQVLVLPLETRSLTTGAQMTSAELEKIPTARDPWAVLQSVPGVLLDQLNVGGNFSGLQSNYTGKGALPFLDVWNLDGVNITDMAATGSTGMFYDFDSFQEIAVTTGGADFAQMTPGVQLNLVTKRGANDLHGSARFFLDRGQWRSQNLTPALEAQGATDVGRINEYEDYGIEVGGALWKDRAWLWGAYARNQIDLIPPPAATDKTTLEDANLKLNLQITSATSLTGSYTQGEKTRLGIDAGVTRPPETALNQSGFDGHPSALYRAELTQVVGSGLFLTASYSYFRGGFELIPASGTKVNNVSFDFSDGWHNGYSFYRTQRPQHNVGATGSQFLRTGDIGHELKFGFSYREAGVVSQTAWPGNGNWTYSTFAGGIVPPEGVAVLTRERVARGKLFYSSRRPPHRSRRSEAARCSSETVQARLRS